MLADPAGSPLLSPVERQVLAAACDALHPSLAAEAGDDATLFATGACRLGVPAAAEEAIGRLAAAERGDLRRLLRLLDSRTFGMVIARVPRGFVAMSAGERALLLQRLALSRVSRLRSGFQALKRLSSFLMYSVTDAAGDNPLWPRLGYDPVGGAAAARESVNTTTHTSSTVIDADVCVIGSGAGGGVAAAELAARGMRVVVLEAGPGDQSPHFEQRELAGMQRLYLDSGLTATRDLGVAILAGACLGGGTTVNWQTCLRTPDYVRDEWSERSGCEHFAGGQFTRALDAVWSRVGASINESTVNANNAVLQRGCASLGYSWTTIARNARGCDPRQCGSCVFGCRTAAKQSTANTYLRDAQLNGDTSIHTGCSVRRITMARGRVTGVSAVARGENGAEHSVVVRAPRVVLAAGGIQSPALLLRSGISLAHVGCNLTLHPAAPIAGVYDEPVEPWAGPPQTVLCDQFSRLDGNFGFRLESAPSHPGILALGMPWTSAVEHRRTMQQVRHAAAIITLTRDSEGGRVRVRRDGSATIDYATGTAERRLLARGIAEAVRVHAAAGAREIRTAHARGLVLRRTAATTSQEIDRFCERVSAEPVDRNRSMLFSAHQMGTCRMGTDPASAVCDERGQVFGVSGLYVADASAFPASSGVNPMISVMALARCVAEGIQ